MISKSNIIISYLINKYPTLDKIYYADNFTIECVDYDINLELALFNDGSIYIFTRFTVNEIVLEHFKCDDAIRRYTIENILT